ncbi:type II toxin-antitoxin system Phd/YefM family antitoxin [Alysiella crassa]|uniref:Antitoxin n=1 Tax=Alysiella crassa TaxID=153491 RepID=A0A376BN39_9NEIS|nr:type II toxin-antitoxin system Phd/YefM family antitoxin [Alysiella crassa]UOP06696.1 type II toxin-antitoxin system Phd/YefM family antitoxin [Alysiella crassa]SSY71197.1 Phd_YefM [Alysiella crassa]
MTVMTSREFNQKTSLAQKHAQTAPVIITNRGKPMFVLMKYDDYQQSKPFRSALEVLQQLDCADDVGNFEWELPPRSRAQRKPVDFGEE